jgi:hypothetical protein
MKIIDTNAKQDSNIPSAAPTMVCLNGHKIPAPIIGPLAKNINSKRLFSSIVRSLGPTSNLKNQTLIAKPAAIRVKLMINRLSEKLSRLTLPSQATL